MRKSFCFGLILLSVNCLWVSRVQAGTLASWQSELNQQKRFLNQARSDRQTLEKRLQDLKIAIEKKQAAIVRETDEVLSKLQISADQKRKELKAKKQRNEEKGSFLKRQTFLYLKAVKSLAQRTRAWMQPFQAYQRDEGNSKTLLNTQLHHIALAQQLSDLVHPRTLLYQLHQRERSLHSEIENEANRLISGFKSAQDDYHQSLQPVQDYLEEYQMTPLSASTLIGELEPIVQYTNQRWTYFSGEIEPRFAALERKMNDMIHSQVEEKLSKQEIEKIHAAACAAYSKAVNQLIQKTVQYAVPENRSSYGCGEKLSGYYEIYEEVLTHQARCSDLERLKREGSIYAPGCVYLVSGGHFQRAQDFFDDYAWYQMTLTLAIAKKNAPASLRSTLQKLDTLVQRGSSSDLSEPLKKETLWQAIRWHDELLEDWKETDEEVSAEPRNSRHPGIRGATQP